MIYRFALLTTFIAAVPANPVSADDATPADSPAPAAVDEPAAPDDTPEEQRRQNLATILFMLLGGVCIVGIALIAGTMIWGAKLRRLARVPESGPTRQDELWYLKKPPPTGEGTGDGEPSS